MKELIEKHKKVAKHLEEAAKYHLEAAKHYEAGTLEKAHLSAIKAQGNTSLARGTQKEIMLHHAT